jgi:[ribosomal protein S18]-alanine N-acetyltransferase
LSSGGSKAVRSRAVDSVRQERNRVKSWQNHPVDCRDLLLGFASRSDAHALAAMARDLIETGLPWTYRADRIARMIGNDESVALVARDGARPVGFAIMSFGEDRAHLALLAVQPTHQRRGLGRRMLEWLQESALTAGIASLHVELRADNHRAYRLYRTMGFAETFRLPGYYSGRETAVRMVKVLRAPGTAAAEVWRPPALDAR